jgi:hypothetical protein
MGLFKFIKDAGSKLFGGDAKAATPEALKKDVQGHGFDPNKINVAVEGGKVNLSRQAMTQERRRNSFYLWGTRSGS